MLMASPYSRPPPVATVLANICCVDNQLPQGAPTSPIIANMLCARLDAHLSRLSGAYRCTYTRYADDLTFSTDQTLFHVDSGRSGRACSKNPCLAKVIGGYRLDFTLELCHIGSR